MIELGLTSLLGYGYSEGQLRFRCLYVCYAISSVSIATAKYTQFVSINVHSKLVKRTPTEDPVSVQASITLAGEGIVRVCASGIRVTVVLARRTFVHVVL